MNRALSPEEQARRARWAKVWLDADGRQPFKIESAPRRPRRRLFGLLP